MPGRQSVPIAIIGMSCRLPGAPDVDAFWDLLREGRDTVHDIPPERFDVTPYLTTGATGAAESIASGAGGFLDEIDQFDAGFFAISPMEARRLDPQHRLLLEGAWEAVEDAGLRAERLAGSNTAVYTGCLSSDYWDVLRGAGLRDLHSAMGAGTWGIPAGRISHLFDLRGPSMGVEAACATSLLAVHLAVTELRYGTSDLAIVGVVNLLMTPDFYVSLSEAEILSPRGRSRFADAAADGYVRSEGVVSLVLKPLPAALADGDRVHATILGTAISNNGSSAGTLIASGREGQRTAIRAAHRDAGVTPADVDYVEAHGPGTPLGDATELQALTDVMDTDRPTGPCLIGSVKSNIGHTEVTAGAAGLVKTVLALKHGTVPATLHVEQPRPELRPDGPLRLAVTRCEWPERDGPTRAGVSSFGLSGVNGHLVLEQPPAPPAVGPDPAPAALLLPLSARHPQALRDLAGVYADLLKAPGGPRPVDICFSAGTRRSHHPHRIAVVTGTGADAVQRLRSFAAGHRPEGLIGGDVRAGRRPRTVFVFSGQGSQWVGMGQSLIGTNEAFTRRMTACDEAIRAELGWSLLERLADGRPLVEVDEVQPALWAVQVSLTAAWQAWGITPDLVVGHSMGEVAAAVVAGALSLAQGAQVVCRRSRLVRELAEPGAMWAVQLGPDEAAAAIAAEPGRVSVGVRNSNHSSVLSGDPQALDRIVTELADHGVFCRRVQVDHASHAPQVDPVGPALGAALADLRPVAGRVPMQSTVTGAPIGGERLDADYWMRNLRDPVRFDEAVADVLATPGPTIFIEVSSHPLLLAALEDGIDVAGAVAVTVPSLFRGRPELESLLTGLAETYVLGSEPDWPVVQAGGTTVDLPAYPWQRRRFWIDAVTEGSRATTGRAAPVVPTPVWPAPLGTAPLGTGADGSGPTGPRPTGPTGATESAGALAVHLAARIAETLGLTTDEIDLDAPASVWGLDSLLAARLAGQLRTDLGLRVPVRDLIGAQPVAELAGDLYVRLHRLGRVG